jgi:hypothetical protein
MRKVSVTARLSPEQVQTLDERAQRAGLGRSAVLRQIIDAGLGKVPEPIVVDSAVSAVDVEAELAELNRLAAG